MGSVIDMKTQTLKIAGMKINAGEKNIVIPSGTYSFDLSDSIPLTVKDKSDLTINGSNSEFICNKNMNAIYLENSKNIVLKNFSIDFNPLPFSQGRIVKVGVDSVKWIDIYIFNGYDIDDLALNNTQLFDPKTLELKKNMSSIYSSYVYSSIEKNYQTRIIRIRRKNGTPDIFNESVGDLVVFSKKFWVIQFPQIIQQTACLKILPYIQAQVLVFMNLSAQMTFTIAAK